VSRASRSESRPAGRGGTVTLEGVTIHLAHPDDLPIRWVGQEDTLRQLLAAWSLADPRDVPMSPRLLGKPGVGKTTLAYAAGRALGRDVYVFQATMDTRPEDLLITPVIDAQGAIRYVASSLVTAMIRGGVAIVDEGNRMSEKSWASLAPLLDARRYVESIVAGVKVAAHPDFRIVATMNDDASTYEIPEYIHSRLQPQIWLDFPDAEEERAILRENLPFSDQAILDYVVEFLQAAHAADERYTVRDGINVARYALKRLAQSPPETLPEDAPPSRRKKAETAAAEARDAALREAIVQVLGEDASRYAPAGDLR
jgi:MoxR-like ATPase